MRIRLIDVHFRGASPGDEINVKKAEADYLIKSGNAIEVKKEKE